MSKPSLIFIGALLLFSANLSAQIATDGTLGPRSNLTPEYNANLDSQDYQIGDNLGQQRGANLFHSFQEFNLNSNESATFSGPSTIQNVISRVTGGNRSEIYGLIRSTIPNADFYFLNPYGIMFGPNASLDVQGSFHASTADYLRFSDETQFEARYSEKPLLTIASIESFGFLGNATESIEVNQSFLAVNPGQALSLVAGNLMIDEATLFAESGQINLVAVGDVQVLIPLSASELAQNTFGLQGDISLTMPQSKAAELWEKAQLSEEFVEEPVFGNIDVSGEGGGQVFIQAGQFYADSSSIFADTHGDTPGASIDIAVEGEVILKNGAQITAENQGENQMGQITINAKEALILSGINEKIAEIIDQNPFSEFEDLFQSASGIRTDNVGVGAGGDIQIITPFLLISPGLIGTVTEGSGKAGDIWIEAAIVQLDRNAMIEAQTVGEGQGGTLRIRATDALSLTEDSLLLADSFGSGNAGNIEIETPDLTLNVYSVIGTSSSQAGGGNITLNVRDSLHVTEDSLISAAAFGDEPQDSGGNITIHNSQFVWLDQNSQLLTRGFVGDGGNINIFTNNLRISNNSWIDPSSQFGLNGEIRLNSLELNENFMAKPLNFLDGSSLLNDRCAGLTIDTISRFIINIRDVLPPGPGDLQTHYLIFDE